MKQAGTYVQISRDDLEDWLSTLRLARKWSLKQGKAGVYILPLAENVAVKLSSTIGTSDDAMGRGQASMQLALISTVTGQVLNKKAQGQSHFARTQNWKKNWAEGVDRMREAYQKAQGFYDALAVIEDRDKYKADTLARIVAVPEWQQNHLLSDFHTRVTQGGILTTAQAEVIIRAERSAPKTPAAEDPILARMRELYKVARQRGDQWLMDFLTSVGQQVKANRPLSEKQRAVLDKNFDQYRI